LIAVGIWLIIVRGSYHTAERTFIWLTLPFFAYPIAAILSHPHGADVGHAMFAPRFHAGSTYLLLLIATIGTTITPYMQHYLQSAVVERGVREEDLAHEEREAVSGAVFANVIAASIIIATGATLYTHGIHEINSAADAARALNPVAGQFAEALFGIGLLGASLLACAILPIATSYVVSESLGYEKGIGRRHEEAPVFMNIITAMIVVSAVVAVIPGLPVISLLVGVQVVNGLLLPINLFFIWQLSRSPALMGERRSKGFLDIAAGATAAILSALSLVLVVVTVTGA
jgi:Mn2+/Fe2+ NRAMP family transporter